MTEHANVIAVARALAMGPCGCVYEMESCCARYDPQTGRADFDVDPGPKTVCLRCWAREALDRDGVEYERVDHLPLVLRI